MEEGVKNIPPKISSNTENQEEKRDNKTQKVDINDDQSHSRTEEM